MSPYDENEDNPAGAGIPGSGKPDDARRRALLISYSRWTAPAMMTLLMNSRASATSPAGTQPQSRGPTKPSGF